MTRAPSEEKQEKNPQSSTQMFGSEDGKGKSQFITLSFLLLIACHTSDITNFRGWRRVWGEPGENREGTRGEPGAPKRTGGEPGAFGKRTGGEPGAFGIHLQRVPGEKWGLWDKNRARTGGREFSLKQETQLGT